MKKNQISNLIMVGLIAVIMIAGIASAWFLMGNETVPQLGSQYTEPLLPDDDGDCTCTVTIVCHAILANVNELSQSKLPYVPADGIILKQVTVSITPGETVFDALKRVCDRGNIQLEYSWTPVYDSYYVEGINHLYEFDCGPESGWMYQVNGVLPSYGCSSYELRGGEEIVWCYTCEGLGADVGAPRE